MKNSNLCDWFLTRIIKFEPTLVAGAAFDFIFDFEITNHFFRDGNFNLNGVAPNGGKDDYYALNKIKLDALEKFVRDKMQQGVDKNALMKIIDYYKNLF